MGSSASLNPDSPSQEFVADPELASEVEKLSKPCAPKVEGILFRQGQQPDAVYLVKSGEVVLAVESDRKMIVCVRAGPGSLLGLPAAVGNRPYSLTAVLCGGAEVWEMAATEFISLIAKNPALSMKVLQLLAAEIRLARRAYFELIA